MGRPLFIAKITQKCDFVLDIITQMCYYIIVKRDRDSERRSAMKAQEIIDIMNENGYAYYGIRVDDNVNYKVGDYTANSRVWVDGEVTEEELDGTSCVGFQYEDEIESALEIANSYFGNCVYVIAGNDMEYGEDSGEYVIKDAVVIAIVR